MNGPHLGRSGADSSVEFARCGAPSIIFGALANRDSCARLRWIEVWQTALSPSRDANRGVWLLSGVVRPRFVGAQSKEQRSSAATMRRRPEQPADPVPPARAPQSPRRGAQRPPALPDA